MYEAEKEVGANLSRKLWQIKCSYELSLFRLLIVLIKSIVIN